MTDITNKIELAGDCTGATWSTEGIKLAFGRGNDWRTTLVPIGAELALAVDGERQCIGYRDSDGFHRCPDHAPASWVAHCDRCHQRNGLKSSGGGVSGSTSDDDAPASGPSHVVYLASYAPGYNAIQTENFLKVGTAGIRRVRERLSEQGAREALVIAAGSQLEVERLEAAICNLDHRRGVDGVKAAPDRRRIKDRLNQSQHLAAWAKTPDQELMVEELERKLHELRRRLPQFSSTFLPDEQVVEMELPYLPPISPACKLLKARNLVLRGRVVGLCGLYLILAADNGEQVALNSRSLAGYTLRALESAELGQDQLALAL